MAHFVIKSVAVAPINARLGYRVSVTPACEMGCTTREETESLYFVTDLAAKGREYEVIEVTKEFWNSALQGLQNGYSMTGKLADYVRRPWTTGDIYN